MADDNKLQYSSAFWKEKLGEEFSFKMDIKQRLHLIFSLLVFLRVTVLELLVFIFGSQIMEVRTRATRSIESFLRPEYLTDQGVTATWSSISIYEQVFIELPLPFSLSAGRLMNLSSDWSIPSRREIAAAVS
jgi:hypothetical protein